MTGEGSCMQPFADRRARALTGFAGGVAVVPSAKTVFRNHDTEYEFRQNSDFYYLTGFDEPDAVLVLAPEHPEHRVILFLRERDRTMETWNGRRLGVEAAPQELGVDVAYPIDRFEELLADYLVGAQTLHYDFGVDEALDRAVRTAHGRARSLTRRRGKSPQLFTPPSSVLHALRSLKGPEELDALRKAAEITARGHLAGMGATRPGLYEYEIEALIEYEYHRAGAHRVAYESIVASGDNATILHYSTNRERLSDGALLLVDSGCEFAYYACDVTRTWPVNGRFTAEQRAIYEIVLAAQKAGCAQVAAGRSQRAFHDAALRTIVSGLIDLGLLSGSVDENIEKEQYRDYYMHGAGHWLGMDVHDVGVYHDTNDDPIVLAPGMVTTVEPGIYISRDLDCDERFKGIGVRIEDDLVVTASGHENLTAAIPKEIADLEAIVGADTRSMAR